MVIHTAGWGGIGTLFFVLFVVLPSIRWGIWGAQWGIRHGPRIGRRYARRWGADWDEDEDKPVGRKGLKALRAELDERLSEVDALHGRVAELENRLDFTERLLAQRSEVGLVPTPNSGVADR